VEKDSAADQAGVKPGDRVVRVNGEPNRIIVELRGGVDATANGGAALEAAGATVVTTPAGRTRWEFDDLPSYLRGRVALEKLSGDVHPIVIDRLDDLVRDWPRGKSRLQLSVERDGKTVDLPSFSPLTVGLYPTQLYETVSMVLLILLLLAFYPYRRHDGQLMVVLMIGYAVHRYLNETLRIEPSYTGGLTLSQWGSVIVLVLALVMEGYLWWSMPSRWKHVPAATKPETPKEPTGQSLPPLSEPPQAGNG
jgi:membrane-associated protease RseP (regulator of RpoE activity)